VNNPSDISDLLHGTLNVVFLVGAPLMITGLIVGFLVSIFQAATQMNDVTFVFIPKLLLSGVVLWLMGPWMFQELERFILRIIDTLPTIGAGGGF
jgi:flagellar biosynthetic protein FliQ